MTILPQPDERDRRPKVDGWTPSLSDRRYVVLWREYSRGHIEHDWDIAPGDGMWEVNRAEAIGLEELEDILRRWSVPLTALTYPWKTDIPE